MPGYPLFIAACGANVASVRIVQSVIDTATVLAAFLIARRWVHGWAVWIAVIFVAFNPYLIYFSSLLLSETLFTAMLVWGMWAILQPRRFMQNVGVMLLILGMFVRPSAIALPIVLIYIAAAVRGESGRRRLVASAVVLFLIFLTLLPWAWRNHRVMNYWIYGTTNDGFTLYDGYNATADGSSDQAAFRAWPALKKMDEVERSDELSRLARDYAVNHPLRDIRLAVAKLGRLWSPIPLSAEYGGRSIYVTVGLLFSVPLFVLALFGAFRRITPKNIRLYLLAPAIYFSVVHAMTVGSLRYRVPADVPLAILAAIGVSTISARNRTGFSAPAV